jgi:hypothetical protein
MKLRTIAMIGVLVCAASITSWAVTKTPRSLYMFDFHAGYSVPTGSYAGIGPANWDGELQSSDLFDPTYHVGIEGGRLWNDHLYMGFGFQYTRINLDDRIDTLFSSGSLFELPELKFHQYDFSFGARFYPGSPAIQSFAPYLGPSLTLGLTSMTAPHYRSETQTTVALNLDFGADFRIWKANDGRSLVTLSSVNSWNVIAGGDRPRFLNIGFGVRYFFRP